MASAHVTTDLAESCSHQSNPIWAR